MTFRSLREYLPLEENLTTLHKHPSVINKAHLQPYSPTVVSVQQAHPRFLGEKITAKVGSNGWSNKHEHIG